MWRWRCGDGDVALFGVSLNCGPISEDHFAQSPKSDNNGERYDRSQWIPEIVEIELAQTKDPLEMQSATSDDLGDCSVMNDRGKYMNASIFSR